MSDWPDEQATSSAPPGRTLPPLDLHGAFEIETPELVSFRMERAGLGTRVAAGLVDTALLTIFYAAIVTAGLLVLGNRFGPGEEIRLAVVGVLIALLTFLFLGYYIAFESIWNGQTPGKRAVGIRVVGDGGMPVTLGMVLVRNVVRLVDVQFGYAIGLISIFVTGEEKRLGDLAAGTAVISERRTTPVSPHVVNRRAAVDPELVELVSDFVRRAERLDDATRHRLAIELAARLADSLGRPPGPPAQAELELAEMARIVLEDPSVAGG